MVEVEVVGVKIKFHNRVYTLPVEGDDIYQDEDMLEQTAIYINWKEQLCRLLETLHEEQNETPPEYNNEE